MASESAPEWVTLSGGETIIWERRPHPIEMGTGLPVAILLVLVGASIAAWSALNEQMGVLTALGGAISVLGFVLGFLRYVVWTNTRYVITDVELYLKRGVVSRDITQFRLDRVQNVSLSQSVLGRLLGYGDLTVYTAGSGDPELTFERVPNPGEASAVVSEQLEVVSGAHSPNHD